MIATNKVALCMAIISFLCVGVKAQSAGPELSHFTAERVSFDYPSGYSVTDESTTDAQQFVIRRKGSSVQLTIVVTRRLIFGKEMPAAGETFREPLLQKVSLTLGQDKKAPQRTSFKTQVGTQEAEGIRLRSTNGAAKTAEVIWLRWSLRLVALMFVRSDRDESIGSQFWQTVTSSLRVEKPVMAVMKDGAEPPKDSKVEGGVLNGKALALPQPPYPPIARAAHASGTVTVQVLIDEEGNVTKAHAIDGHPLLQAVSVAAALQARFTPTMMEGEPVRVTGVIQYHFVAAH